MNKVKEYLLRGARTVPAMFLGAAVVVALYAAEPDVDGLLNFNSAEVVSASEINANFKLLMNRIKVLEAGQVPSGSVIALTTTCPSGWWPADGANGTPDLRGVFLRGLNNFGLNADGEGLNVAGTRDPDTRIFGAFQDFQVGPHTHNPNTPLFNRTPGGSSEASGVAFGPMFGDGGASGISRTGSILSNGGTETRPRNIAVYFCVKK